MPGSPTRNPGRYPLTAVFVLTAVVAVMAGLVQAGLARHTFDQRFAPEPPYSFSGRKPDPLPEGMRYVEWRLVIAVAIAGGVLAGLGGAFGGGQAAGPRGVVMGGLTSMAVGGCGGMILVCPPSPTAIATAFGTLVAVGVGMRILSRPSAGDDTNPGEPVP